jgi:hypothetical protein
MRWQTTQKETTSDSKNIEEEIIQDVSVPSHYPQKALTLPDSAQKIDQIITIIKTHWGDQEIVIHDKTFLLNEEGIKKIQDLLIK